MSKSSNKQTILKETRKKAGPFYKRLMSTYFNSLGHWEIARDNNVMTISREPIVAPLFSPYWYFAFFIGLYLSYVIQTGLQNGWHGIEALLLPFVFIFFLALGNDSKQTEENDHIEQLRFSANTRRIEVTYSDGESQRTVAISYTEIGYVNLQTRSNLGKTWRISEVCFHSATDDQEILKVECLRFNGEKILCAITEALDSCKEENDFI